MIYKQIFLENSISDTKWKVQSVKEHINNTSSKWKTLAFKKTWLREWKDMTQTDSKYIQNIDLIKGLVSSKFNNEEKTQLKTGIRLTQIVQRRYAGVI